MTDKSKPWLAAKSRNEAIRQAQDRRDYVAMLSVKVIHVTRYRRKRA